MAELKCLLFVILVCFLDFIQNTTLLCNEEFCRTYIRETGCTTTSDHCRINNATHSGIFLPSPTACNCCQFCLPFYLEGEHCSTGGPGTGATIGRCADGLTCALDETDGDTKCTRMKSDCHDAQDEFDAREARGEIGALENRPLCDGKGKYAPADCIPTNTCFCQSEDGKRIFGETMYLGAHTIRNMQCGCSRLHEKIKRGISPGVQYPVTGPRCTQDGNFNPVQCLGRICYCVDPITGVIQTRIPSIDLDEHPLTKLECYNSNLDLFPQYSEGDPPYEYTTPCLEAIEDKIQLVQQSEEEGYNTEFGGGYEECYPDGTYGRIAYTNTGSKVCVNNHGRRIGDYEAFSGTTSFNTMDCKCALTSYLMGASSEKPVCCKNGNFRPIQCRRGMCRCVDPDGRQTVRESFNVNTLPCHTTDWQNC